MDQLNITDLGIQDLTTTQLTVEHLTVQQLQLQIGPWMMLALFVALLSVVALSVSTIRYHARESSYEKAGYRSLLGVEAVATAVAPPPPQ